MTADTAPPPDIYQEIVFDPHVLAAVIALLVALIIIFVLTTIPIKRDRDWRK